MQTPIDLNRVSILDIISIAVGLWALYRGFRFAPLEIKQINSDTVEKYATAASASIDSSVQLGRALAELYKRLETVEEEGRIYRRIQSDWYEGIEILLGQLRKAGIEPEWTPKDPETYFTKAKGDS